LNVIWKIVVKVLMYTRTASAKLKIFRKISKLTRKKFNFIPKYAINKM